MTGTVLYFIERGSTRSVDYAEAGGNWVRGVGVSVYLTFAVFTGIGGWTPATRGGRLLSCAMGFVFVVVMAAHTANLAAYLTVQATPVHQFNSIEDVISQGVQVCARPQQEARLKSMYPGLQLVPTHLHRLHAQGYLVVAGDDYQIK